MAKRRTREQSPEDLADGPAVVTPFHRFDRELTTRAGGPRAWRSLSPLQAAFERGQLNGGNRRFLPEQRFEAGIFYERHFLTAHASGRNCLELSSGGHNGASGLSQAQMDALKALALIHNRLSPNDSHIVRKVCGEGETPVNAIATACGPDYRFSTMVRFREALDALVCAVDRFHHHPLTAL